MRTIVAAILLALGSLVSLTTFADGHNKAQEIKGPIDESQWVQVKPPLKPGKYTLRVERWVSAVGCEDELCGCWQSGASCGSDEICVGLGICVPKASGIRGGPDVPTYMMP